MSTLRDVAVAYSTEGSSTDRLQSIGSLLEPNIQILLEKCEEHIALVTGNYLQLLLRFFPHPRRALLLVLERIPLESTTQDKTLEQAIRFVLQHRQYRKEWLDLERGSTPAIDLSSVTDQWWPLVTGTKVRSLLPSRVHHHYLELCVLSQVANELKSCDLCSRLGNLVTLSFALERLQQDGLKASDEALAALTPYQTEHINRFGNYMVNFNRAPEPLPVRFRKSPSSEPKGQAAFDYASGVERLRSMASQCTNHSRRC